MNGFVLDASITLSWFIDASIAPLAVHVRHLLLQGKRAFVPYIWRPQVANGFVIAQRRGLIAEDRVAQAYSELELLLAQSVESVKQEFSIRHIAEIAHRYRLTAYDATYLETGRELRLPLATLDRQLAQAADKAGVELIS